MFKSWKSDPEKGFTTGDVLTLEANMDEREVVFVKHGAIIRTVKDVQETALTPVLCVRRGKQSMTIMEVVQLKPKDAVNIELSTLAAEILVRLDHMKTNSTAKRPPSRFTSAVQLASYPSSEREARTRQSNNRLPDRTALQALEELFSTFVRDLGAHIQAVSRPIVEYESAPSRTKKRFLEQFEFDLVSEPAQLFANYLIANGIKEAIKMEKTKKTENDRASNVPRSTDTVLPHLFASQEDEDEDVAGVSNRSFWSRNQQTLSRQLLANLPLIAVTVEDIQLDMDST
eukprot:GILJ01029062.1.p1 GENE.GILJ01029062.1~~GILJ01029062.1.p1  ORF type:complete len:287 (+),score=48.15 GILJ01029062.1:523-1383(+)